MDKYRDRKYCLVLYPEDPTHCVVMDKLKSGYQFCAILHDKDTYIAEDTDDVTKIGTLKKPHWHVVLKFPQARWNTAVAQELGLAPNYLQRCNSYQGALLYLIHFGLPEKYQYSIDEVFGNLVKDLKKAMRSDDECSRIKLIVEFVDGSDYLTMKDLIQWSYENDLWDVLRRMGQYGIYLLNQHNEAYESSFSASADVDKARFDGFVQGHCAGREDRKSFRRDF